MVMYPPLRQKSLTFWPFPSHRISFISVEISPRVNAIFRTVEISPRVGLLPQCWSRLRLSGRCLDLFLLWPTYYFFFFFAKIFDQLIEKRKCLELFLSFFTECPLNTFQNTWIPIHLLSLYPFAKSHLFWNLTILLRGIWFVDRAIRVLRRNDESFVREVKEIRIA